MCHVLSAILLTFQLWTSVVAGLGLNATRDMKILPAPFGTTTLDLPGCLNEDPSVEESITHECLVAKTAFALPNFCSLYPATRNCVILLAPAFCFDGDIVSTGKMQDCLAKVPLGPCKANPTGRACSSGLFAGFELIGNPIPPNRRPGANNNHRWPGIYVPTEGSPDVFYGGAGDPTWDLTQLSSRGLNSNSTIWIVGQFFEGIAIDLFDSGIEIAELATYPFRKVMSLDCWVGTKAAYAISEADGQSLDAICTVLTDTLSTAASYLDRYELQISNKYQGWGATTSEIAQILLGAIDVFKAVLTTAKLVKLFVVISDKSGSYLRAASEVGEIIILQLRGNGEAAAMKEAEARRVLEDLNEKGFEDLVRCDGLKSVKPRIDPPWYCLMERPDMWDLNDEWDGHAESSGARVSADDPLIEDPVQIPIPELPEPARAGRPADEEIQLQPEAVVISSGGGEVSLVENRASKGKRPAAFTAEGDEYQRESRSFRLADEAGSSAAEVPGGHPYPDRGVDPALVDDVPADPNWLDPRAITFPDEPLQVFPDILPRLDVEIDFLQVQYTGDRAAIPAMQAFEQAYKDGLQATTRELQVSKYWRDLQNSGMSRQSIRDLFVKKFQLGTKFDGSLGIGSKYKPNNIGEKLQPVLNREVLPLVEGIGYQRVTAYQVGLTKTLKGLNAYFEYPGQTPLESLVYTFKQLTASKYGSVFYPGFNGIGQDYVEYMMVFSKTTGRLFGPLIERYAADAYYQLTSDCDYKYRLVGRIRATKAKWIYFFEFVGA